MLSSRTPNPRPPRGFTLTELAGGVAIIGIIAAIAVTTFQLVSRRGEAHSIDATLRQVELVAHADSVDAVEGDGSDPATQLYQAAGTVVIPQEEIDEGTASPVVADVGNGVVYVHRYEQCRVLVLDGANGGQGTIYSLEDFLGSTDPAIQAIVATDADGFIGCEPGEFAPSPLFNSDAPGTPAVTATPAPGPGNVEVSWTPAAVVAGSPGTAGDPGTCPPVVPPTLLPPNPGNPDSNGDGCGDTGYVPPTPPTPPTAGTGEASAFEVSYDDPADDAPARVHATVPADTLAATINGLPDRIHDFCVVAINNAGRSTPGCDQATPGAATITAPNPILVPSNATLAVDWDPLPAEQNIGAYDIRIDGAGSGSPRGPIRVQTTSYVFDGLTNGTPYTVFVAGVRGPGTPGEELGPEGQATGTPQAGGIVLPPRNPIATPDGQGDDILVVWEGSDTPEIDRYEIHRAEAGTTNWQPLGTTPGDATGAEDLDINDTEDAAATLPRPETGITYSYRVRAVVDGLTPSDWAGPASARLGDTAAPVDVGNVIATVHDHEGATAADEIVSPGPDQPATVVADDSGRYTPPAGYPFTPPGGCTDAPACTEVQYPLTPRYPINNEIEVRWTLPVDADRNAVRVEANGIRLTPDPGLPLGDFNPTTTSIVLVDVLDGDYVFDVYAVDAAGNTSGRITSNQVTIDTTAPPLPVDRQAVDVPRDPSSDNPLLPAHDIDLTWDVGPAFDLTGATFILERCDIPVGSPVDNCFNDPAEWGTLTPPVDPDDERFTDDTVEWGWIYCYRVQAYDTVGNRSWFALFDAVGDGATPEGCIETQDAFEPQPDPDLVIAEAHRQLDLDWPDAAEHPRQSGMDRYDIDRRQPPGPFTLWDSIGFPPGNSAAVDADDDGDMPWLRLYDYRVTALDREGNATTGSSADGIALDLYDPISPGATPPANYDTYPLVAGSGAWTSTDQGTTSLTPSDGALQSVAGGPGPDEGERRLLLDWDPSVDDYSGVGGYTVQRFTPGQTDPAGSRPWTTIQTLPATTTSLTQTSWHTPGSGQLYWGTTYCYRVRTFDNAADHPRQTVDNTSAWTAHGTTLGQAGCSTPDDHTNPTFTDFHVQPISDTNVDGESDILWRYDRAADDFAGIHSIRITRTFDRCESGTCTGHTAGQVQTIHADTTVDGRGRPAGPYDADGSTLTGCNEVWDYRLEVVDHAGNTLTINIPDISCDGSGQPPNSPDDCGDPGMPACPEPRCDDPDFGPCPNSAKPATGGASVQSLEHHTFVSWGDVARTDPDGDFRCYRVEYIARPHDAPRNAFNNPGLWAPVPGTNATSGCTTTTTSYTHGAPTGSRNGYQLPGTLDPAQSFVYRVRSIDMARNTSPWAVTGRAEPWARPTMVNTDNTTPFDGDINLTWPDTTDRDDGGLADGVAADATYRIHTSTGDRCDRIGDLDPTGAEVTGNTHRLSAPANNVWNYQLVVPVDTEGHPALLQRDAPSSGTAFHDQLCAYEGGVPTIDADTPEAFRADVRTWPGQQIAGGQSNSTVRVNSAATIGACPTGTTEVNGDRHGLHDDLGPYAQDTNRSWCAASTDRYGNRGPWADVTDQIRDLTPPRNAVVGVAQNNPRGNDPDLWIAEIRDSRFDGSSTGADYFRYRYVDRDGDVRFNSELMAPTGNNLPDVGAPYGEVFHLQVVSCHPDRTGNECMPWTTAANSLNTTTGRLSSATRSQRDLWAIEYQNTQETPTYSVTRNVGIRNDASVTCGSIVTPGGEWTADNDGTTDCYTDLGGNPYTGFGNGGTWVGQSHRGFYNWGSGFGSGVGSPALVGTYDLSDPNRFGEIDCPSGTTPTNGPSYNGGIGRGNDGTALCVANNSSAQYATVAGDGTPSNPDAIRLPTLVDNPFPDPWRLPEPNWSWPEFSSAGYPERCTSTACNNNNFNNDEFGRAYPDRP